MPDYFTEVEAAIREEQSRDPDVVLPWSWWQAHAQRHGMTPNAVYTRAVKSHVYLPPSKREPQPGSAEPAHLSDVEWGERSTSLSPGIGGAIQGFASLVERTAALEQQVAELKRALERARAENRRLRRALEQADALALQVTQIYRSALIHEPDEGE